MKIDGLEPYYEDKAGVIYCGDCLEILPKIPDKSVDLIITSPPFLDENVSELIGNQKTIGDGRRRNHNCQNWDNEEYYTWLHGFISESIRISKITLMFNSSRRLKEICKRFDPDRILIWDKRRSESVFRYEPIFCWSDLNLNKYIWNDCLAYLPVIGHLQSVPFENPLKLYKRLLSFFNEVAEIILDPFLGSGTTAMAAKQSGKNFIGIEINPERCKIAKQRLSQEILI